MNSKPLAHFIDPRLLRDYYQLTKPKVVVLMLITSLVGMFLATRAGVPWTVLVFGNLGIALCAGGAAVVKGNVSEQDGLCRVFALIDDRVNAEGFERILGRLSGGVGKG